MNKYGNILPDLKKVNYSNLKIRKDSHLIIVAGFEERSISFLNNIAKENNKFKIKSASIIEYDPHLDKNKKHFDKINKNLKVLNVNDKNIHSFTFDRSYPIDFDQSLDNLTTILSETHHVYCDISGMSKLLILYILKTLRDTGKSFSIIYSAAEFYAPTKKKYEEIKQSEQSNLNEFFPLGVFDPFIPPMFSGSTPLGVDRVLIGFLSYNKRQLLGATNIVPYQFFIPFIGVPPKSKWKWRTEALVEINNEGLLSSHKYIRELPKIDINDIDSSEASKVDLNQEYSIYLSTLYYKETFIALEWVARKHRYKHFLTIAPFGSKLQTVSVFLFCLLNPETQIVYSSPKDYYDDYSKGTANTFKIDFNNIQKIESNLRKITDPNFDYLESNIDWKNDY